MTEEFEQRLEKEISIRAQEIHDGCVDCLQLPDGVFCREHEIEVMDLICSPKKLIKLKALKT